MLKIKPILLKGSWLHLEPMSEMHRKELFASAQNETIWAHTATQAYVDQFHHWFEVALRNYQARDQLPFVARRISDQKIMGSTRLHDINYEHRRLAIGYTWLIPEMWGSYVNPECKLLLLNYAFEELQMNRVELLTDFRNTRSKAAIKKLGAKEEGTLRQHMVLGDGSVRDTALFSIVRNEWPRVKTTLERRLKAFKNKGSK
jgi:N-acetyltransferase